MKPLSLLFILGLLCSPLAAELIRNGDFSAGMRGWELERLQNAEATAGVGREGDAKAFARVVTEAAAAAAHHVQLVQRRLSLEEGRAYRITFRARAEPAARIVVNLKLDRAPWPNLWTQPVNLGPEWKAYSYTFKASQSTDIARLTFSSLGAQAGRFDFSDVSIVLE